MKSKLAIAALMTTVLMATPLAPAHAKGHRPQGNSDSSLYLGLFAAGLTGAAIALATAPNTVVVRTLPPPPPPIYVTPVPVYYYNYAPIHRHRPVYSHRPVMTYGTPYPAYAIYR